MILQIIDHYYGEGSSELKELLLSHSRAVADKALQICDAHPEFGLDRDFIEAAAMLHDIGIIRCDAPKIHCHGTEPYIRHGILGAEILRSEGLPRHADVAERHTGTGLTAAEIARQNLPLPPHDFTPRTIEEQIICYADKFYSKSHPDVEKTPGQAMRSLEKFGSEGIAVFKGWMERFE